MNRRIILIDLRYENDVVVTRQRAAQIARALGFTAQDQTRISTAVSEIARNTFEYAGSGTVEFLIESVGEGKRQAQELVVTFKDQGPGIARIEEILQGGYRSDTGMGVGITGARRLMDRFEIETATGAGTRVLLAKRLPPGEPVGSRELAQIAEHLASQSPPNPLEEVRRENRALMEALDELRIKQDELTELNRELEETNRGVVALYAELDEKAAHLRRASESKTRFLSSMTHELRTPVNSVQSLVRLLLERADGPLTEEQEKQLVFIQTASQDLSELINDLLDLAKVEAGRVAVKVETFEVAELFGTLRGMFKPWAARNPAIELVFEEPAGIPALKTDQGKVSQVLRNFISNALKYTESGEVRVTARALPGDQVVFAVTDTGIGISTEDQPHIFEEFSQIDSHLQRRVKGTGLGLPLANRLALLLGGRIQLRSVAGQGSEFSAIIPRIYRGAAEVAYLTELSQKLDPARTPVLVVADRRESLLAYDQDLRETEFQVIEAKGMEEASSILRSFRPAAIVLDSGEADLAAGAELLHGIRANESLRGVPILVCAPSADPRSARLEADAWLDRPVERTALLAALTRLTRPAGRATATVLVIDDDEISRYLVKRALSALSVEILEAAGGREGELLARERRPDAVVLDLVMPEVSGFDVLARLKADPATRDIPVIVHSSKTLSASEREALASATAVITKTNDGEGARTSAALLAALREAGIGTEEAA